MLRLLSLFRLQQTAGVSLHARNYSRKSRLDYVGMRSIYSRPIPSSEWINPTTRRPWSRKTIERRLRERPEWAITSQELKQIRNVGSSH